MKVSENGIYQYHNDDFYEFNDYNFSLLSPRKNRMTKSSYMKIIYKELNKLEIVIKLDFAESTEMIEKSVELLSREQNKEKRREIFNDFKLKMQNPK